MTLASRMGVKPTIQTIKRLEHSYKPTFNPRPLKKRAIEMVRRAKDDDEVLLGYSDNTDIDEFMAESAAGPSGTTHRYANTAQ